MRANTKTRINDMRTVGVPVSDQDRADRRTHRWKTESMSGDASGWVGWFPGGENPHLAPEVREKLERDWQEIQERRGRHLAHVVVDVFENGDAVPQVQFPPESTIGPTDRARTAEAVRLAAAALANWR